MENFREFIDVCKHLQYTHTLYDKKIGYIIHHKGPLYPPQKLLSYYRSILLKDDDTENIKVRIIYKKTWQKIQNLYKDMTGDTLATLGFHTVNLKFKSSMRQKQFVQKFHTKFHTFITEYDTNLEILAVNLKFYRFSVKLYMQNLKTPQAFLYANKTLRFIQHHIGGIDILLYLRSLTFKHVMVLRVLCLRYQGRLLNCLNELQDPVYKQILGPTGYKITHAVLNTHLPSCISIFERTLVVSFNLVYLLYLHQISQHLRAREFLQFWPHPSRAIALLKKDGTFRYALRNLIFRQCIPVIFWSGVYTICIPDMYSFKIYPAFDSI